MKPRIFIGSSVEGLNVAYSIQQNLTQYAEVTVWDQGVFELSKTTIESLVNVLEKSDFGIFVFSSDDITKIRDNELNTVRDNVLFEFGLFIGMLSRERVYFVIPSNTELHLPTDLLGITPGKYEPNREDGSMQAATGPVSNQIRQMIRKLRRISTDDENPSSSDEKTTLEDEDYIWKDDFLSKKYDDAKNKLATLAKNEKDPDKILKNTIWSAYCDLKIKEVKGIELLDEILEKNPDNILSHRSVAAIYLREEYLDKAVDILSNALEKFKGATSLLLILSECYKKMEGTDKAIEFLSENKPYENPEIAIELADILMDKKEFSKAREHIHAAYQNFPNNEGVKFIYARIAQELEINEVALFLLNSLTKEFDTNSNYWGYLSNSALLLDYYDLALFACKKAEEITESKDRWILSNIGNIFSNKGFYVEAINYLEKALELDKDSGYAHDRLSTSIKLRDEEKENVRNACKNGRKLIRDFRKE